MQTDTILVFRDPGPETFSTSLVFHRGESISLLSFPELSFRVDDLLG